MLPRLECVIALLAVHMMLDIPTRIRAVRNIIARHIGNLRQLLFEFGGDRLLLLLQRRQRGLEPSHLGHQLAGLSLVLRLLGFANFLGRRIPSRLRLLECRNRCPALFVQRHELFRQRLEPAPFKSAVEGVRMLANPFDVVHGGVSNSSWPGLSPQVGFTRPAQSNSAEVGRARLPVPSTSYFWISLRRGCPA